MLLTALEPSRARWARLAARMDTATPSDRNRVLHVGWLLARLPWLAVMTGVLVAVVAWAGRFERPSGGLGTHQRVLLGVLVAGFVGWAVALY